MFSQLLTLYVTPVFYVVLERMVAFFKRRRVASESATTPASSQAPQD